MTIPIFVVSSSYHCKVLDSVRVMNRLVSYFYIKKNSGTTLRDRIGTLLYDRPDDAYFLFDSGAFSAWRKGEIIGLYDYIEAVLELQDMLSHYVCLDVIDDPVMSEAHHQIMLDEGCRSVVPVFHSGEPLGVLQYLVDRGYDYIGISPNNDWPEAHKLAWLQYVYTGVDLTGTRTHGFGYFGFGGIAKYPLTTADSLQWVLSAASGSIPFRDGTRVFISSKSTHKKEHITHLPGYQQEAVRGWIVEVGVCTEEDLVCHTKMRMAFSARAFELIAARLSANRKPITKVQNLIPELFDVTRFEEDVFQMKKRIQCGEVGVELPTTKTVGKYYYPSRLAKGTKVSPEEMEEMF